MNTMSISRVCWLWAIVSASIRLSLLISIHVVILDLNCHADDIVVSRDGRARHVIFVGAGASEAEKYAAAELRDVLARVAGAEFLVVDSLPEGRAVIAVGPQAAIGVIPDLALGDLGNEGILVRSSGDNFILSGSMGSSRGTLYAVYAFLHDQVGCRWWTPRASYIPARNDLVLSSVDYRYVPPMEYRDVFIYSARDPDWAARNHCNGIFPALDDRHGGCVGYAPIPSRISRFAKGVRPRGINEMLMVHTFDRLIPAGTYFASHPEWFSEIDGRRHGPVKTQWCLSNLDLLAACLDRVRAVLRGSPSETIVSISQNDWQFRCQCAKCMEIESDEGSPSGPLLRFVNGVAEAIAGEFPRAAIDTLAYRYTRKPPLKVRPLPNVIVRLCSIESDFSKPFQSGENKDFLADLAGWSKICNRLYVWDYHANFRDYLAPFPNLRVLGSNVRLLNACGVRGILAQGSHESPGGEFAELRAWVLSRLLWNPDLDERALELEFINGYYGQAAPQVQAVVDSLHMVAGSSSERLASSSDLNASYFSDAKVLQDVDAVLFRAEDAVRGDLELLRRVRDAHLPIRYILLRNYEKIRWDALRRGVPWQAGAYRDIAASVLDISRSSGIIRFGEGYGSDLSTVSRRVEFLAGAQVPDPDPSTIEMSLSARSFRLYGPITDVDIQEDPLSLHRVGARMSASHRNWAVQVPIPPAALGGGAKRWRVFWSVRMDGTQKDGDNATAFECGIYDAANRQWVSREMVSCGSMGSMGYRRFFAGDTAFNNQCYAWIAPAGNANGNQFIWVDGIIFVPLAEP